MNKKKNINGLALLPLIASLAVPSCQNPINQKEGGGEGGNGGTTQTQIQQCEAAGYPCDKNVNASWNKLKEEISPGFVDHARNIYINNARVANRARTPNGTGVVHQTVPTNFFLKYFDGVGGFCANAGDIKYAEDNTRSALER